MNLFENTLVLWLSTWMKPQEFVYHPFTVLCFTEFVSLIFKSKIALEAMVTLSQSYAVRIFSLGFSTANVLIYLNMKQSNFTIKHNDRSWII